MPTLSIQERRVMRCFKQAAQSAVAFSKRFKIQSSTDLSSQLFPQCIKPSDAIDDSINGYRDYIHNKDGVPYRPDNAVFELYFYTLEHRKGNCLEHSATCYLSLLGHPVLSSLRETVYISWCHSPDYDHGFVVLSLVGLPEDQWVVSHALGIEALIIDGWTKDWHFPNTSDREFCHGANLWKRHVRRQLRRHTFFCYRYEMR